MSNNFFRFKQFAVFQEYCAMKVGTDGVLLGAWTNLVGCRHILDIGTGTGLIALMMAQRNRQASIDAIEIDEGCVREAQQNIALSPFVHRIDVQQSSFQDFRQLSERKYDLIVSNPPFFDNSLKSPCHARNHARHNDTLSFFDIISEGAALLEEEGRIAMILPHEFKQAIMDHAATCHLFAHRITNVFPVPHKPAKRLLIELGAKETDCIEKNLTIEIGRHQYTDEYNELTSEFYLDR